MSQYRSAPEPTDKMPSGIPFIVGNEAAERFSFYGMKGILVVFMTKYLFLMDGNPGEPMSDAEATKWFHVFSAWVYATPIAGALLADAFFGKYRTILWLSLGYCVGHGLLAMMGMVWSAEKLLMWGLIWVTIGAGGIKPCVSAHVGDQFGRSNAHLLPKVFNYFYWSINLGAFFSVLLTPWLLEWHGPHWAFGVPGALMAIATFVFWLGRKRFIHIPAKGTDFLKDICSRASLIAMGKLSIIYAFIAVFWALFDQHASSWILQAEDLDLRFLGVTWLPSQIQMANPILVLTFIPIFTFGVYPLLNKLFPLTALRKMAIGFFLMVPAFVIVANLQEAIDAGARPSVGWQFLAFIFLTASEVMVSIVGLEFSYTQAPRSLKSVVMGLFFFAVFLGNYFTAAVNHYIETPDHLSAVRSAYVSEEGIPDPTGSIVDVGFDEIEGTEDDITVAFEKGQRTGTTFAGQELLIEAADRVETALRENDWNYPPVESGEELMGGLSDPWGNPILYTVITRDRARVWSAGPDQEGFTQWDTGLAIQLTRPSPPQEESAFDRFERSLRPDEPWIDRRMKELGMEVTVVEAQNGGVPVASRDYFVGGQTKLQGAAYFWFFVRLMIGTAILFLVVMVLYKPREYLHEEASETA